MSGDKETKPIWKRWYVWVAAIVILGGLSRMGGNAPNTIGSAATTNQAEAKQEVKAADVNVSADRYFSDYEGNEVAADETYKGKTIEIRGRVAEVRKTLGSIYIDLATSNPFLKVACKMSNEQGLSSITKGSSITLIGTGDGKVIYPQLEDCSVK